MNPWGLCRPSNGPFLSSYDFLQQPLLGTHSGILLESSDKSVGQGSQAAGNRGTDVSVQRTRLLSACSTALPKLRLSSVIGNVLKMWSDFKL